MPERVTRTAVVVTHVKRRRAEEEELKAPHSRVSTRARTPAFLRRHVERRWPVSKETLRDEHEPTHTTKPAMYRAFSGVRFFPVFLSFLFFTSTSAAIFRFHPRMCVSLLTASAISNRRCFCLRGGRHFDTPGAQQRSHTRSFRDDPRK